MKLSVAVPMFPAGSEALTFIVWVPLDAFLKFHVADMLFVVPLATVDPSTMMLMDDTGLSGSDALAAIFRLGGLDESRMTAPFDGERMLTVGAVRSGGGGTCQFRIMLSESSVVPSDATTEYMTAPATDDVASQVLVLLEQLVQMNDVGVPTQVSMSVSVVPTNGAVVCADNVHAIDGGGGGLITVWR